MRRAAGVALALVLVAVLARVVIDGGSSSRATHRPPAPRPAGAAAAAAGTARVVSQHRVAPNIVDLAIRAPALGETVTVRLVTPQGWARRASGRRWPVFYLLHGCCDTPESWTRNTDVARIAALRHVLVVIPAGGRSGWYSDWWNHGTGGIPAWETFHLTELRRLLERDYGAGRRRAIAGLSMGGAQTLAVSTANLQDYGYVGVFSSGLIFENAAEWEKNHKDLLGDSADKAGLKLLWFATGSQDFLLARTKETTELFKRNGYQPVFKETPGGHTWINWQQYLNEFAPQLFQK